MSAGSPRQLNADINNISGATLSSKHTTDGVKTHPPDIRIELEGSGMRRARPLLGTIVDISAEDAPETLPDAIEAAFASIEAVHRLMSFHELDSDVSRINDAKAGEVVQIDPRTFHVLHFARQPSDLSAGAFDVTTASVLVRSGSLPERATEALPIGVTYRDLDLLPAARVRWRNKGWIDLGGIAAGFAVDPVMSPAPGGCEKILAAVSRCSALCCCWS
jgi:thiamine biosynthesis lipoprotein ApbE